jgi:hypothetical protein
MYILADPNSLKVRYIGITKERYLSKRLGGHKFDAVNRNGKTHHHRWLQKLYSSGKKPIMKKIAEFSTWKEAREVELRLINKYKESHNLTNSNDEGLFTSVGNKSARVYFTKPIYLYDVDGNFVKEFLSTKDICKELSITKITVSKILARKGKAKNGIIHKFQLSRVKLDKMEPMYNTSNRYQSQFKPLNQVTD